MFHRFIVATDLSPASFSMVSCIGGLKALGARKCLLLQCLTVTETSSVTMASKMDFLESMQAEQKQILEDEGFVTSTRFVPGFAKTNIDRIAEDEDYSLIVVGSRGHGLMGEALLGGVAYTVMHSAKKPVLLVKVEMGADGGEACIHGSLCDFGKHILFPTDFSENADHAFSYLKDMVASGVDRVTLFHVQDETRIDSQLIHRIGEFNEIDRGRLEQMKAELEKLRNVQIEINLAYGAPVQEILRLIREKDVHIVMMGSQGRGFVKEIFLGSVSHSVARLSPASVLLIPAIR
jgi:nucleotide-binding universal stress UspA family protein